MLTEDFQLQAHELSLWSSPSHHLSQQVQHMILPTQVSITAATLDLLITMVLAQHI